MKKNILIAFCGMDGTGKSTLSKLLSKQLVKFISIKTIHSHGYVISKQSFGLTEKQIKKWRIFFTLLSPFTLIDHWLNHIKYTNVLEKSSLILDRYSYDKIVRLMYYGIIGENLGKLYAKLVPKADITFLLDINEYEALKRKSEYTIEEFIRFRKLYLLIAKSQNIPIINTELSLKSTIKTVLLYVKSKNKS